MWSYYITSFEENEDGIDTNATVACWSYQLFQTVPNRPGRVVESTWKLIYRYILYATSALQRPVVLPFLNFSAFHYITERVDIARTAMFRCSSALENLEFEFSTRYLPIIRFLNCQGLPPVAMLKEADLDVICRDESVQLRHLTLRCLCKSVNVCAMSTHLI